MTQISTSFPDSSYSDANKPQTATLKLDIQAIEDAHNAHEDDTVPHGATGAVVGTTNAQTLTNKTLTSPVLNTGVSGTAIVDEDNMVSDSPTKIPTQQSVKAYTDAAKAMLLNMPEGSMINGKIVPSVASDNLTVALKTKAGTDPSATDPVYVMIGGTLRTITEALSKSDINAGTNWGNTGSAELATKEVDWFTYLGYRASDGVVFMGISRIPYGNVYSDFSGTATNEKVFASSATPAATDTVVNIGRFAATLSAGAGYTWSVPTFTASNLIQRPIYETRWLDWQPVYTGSGSLTFGTVTTGRAKYKLVYDTCQVSLGATGTTGGTTSTTINASVPFGSADTSTNLRITGNVADTTSYSGFCYLASGILSVRKYDGSNWGLGAGRQIFVSGEYSI